MPNLDRILETALYVDHLEQAADFYVNILGLRRLFRDDRLQAFSVGRQSVLLLFQRGASLETTRLPGGTIPPHDGHGPLHIAFAIAAKDLPKWEARLRRHKVGIEGSTEWPRGGHSIYFRDPDGNLLELATPGLWEIY
jgi:catechol 2,3-dioxygenase-like lactoylglutathione lyase family enzyme